MEDKKPVLVGRSTYGHCARVDLEGGFSAVAGRPATDEELEAVQQVYEIPPGEKVVILATSVLDHKSGPS